MGYETNFEINSHVGDACKKRMHYFDSNLVILAVMSPSF